jgi:hypothetical protein
VVCIALIVVSTVKADSEKRLPFLGIRCTNYILLASADHKYTHLRCLVRAQGLVLKQASPGHVPEKEKGYYHQSLSNKQWKCYFFNQ